MVVVLADTLTGAKTVLEAGERVPRPVREFGPPLVALKPRYDPTTYLATTRTLGSGFNGKTR